MLREVLKEKVTITENGRRRKINKMEAILKQLVNDAVKGDPRARKEVIGILPRLEREQAPPNRAAAPPRGAIVVIPHR
jgi:hypothetical protein